MSALRFEIKPFDALTLHELYAILYLRDLVFVVGQKITEVPEIDGEDVRCMHAMLYDGESLVGTARAFHLDDPISVGRIAIVDGRQGEGLGTHMMLHIQDWLGSRRASMHAQAHLEGWYSRLGWVRAGDDFMEAGILHTPMVWQAGR